MVRPSKNGPYKKVICLNLEDNKDLSKELNIEIYRWNEVIKSKNFSLWDLTDTTLWKYTKDRVKERLRKIDKQTKRVKIGDIGNDTSHI